MDKKIKELTGQAMHNGATLAVMNALHDAKKYTGILDAVVCAGSLQNLASELGVTYQAVQQWLKLGYVPLSRIPEIEALFGVPRVELMNPKYAAALAEPNFSDVDSDLNVARKEAFREMPRRPKVVPILDKDV